MHNIGNDLYSSRSFFPQKNRLTSQSSTSIIPRNSIVKRCSERNPPSREINLINFVGSKRWREVKGEMVMEEDVYVDDLTLDSEDSEEDKKIILNV